MSPESDELITGQERIVEGERIDPRTGCAEGDSLAVTCYHR